VAQLMDGIRVLELARHVAGPFAGKLFADYGADVLKVEPPAGDPSRHEGPFHDDDPHPEKSALFLHLNTNKRSVTLDPETAEGRSILRRLIDEADVVIEDFRPGQMAEWGLDYEALAAERPEIIVASITPFGQDGPWRDYRGSEITLQAMGGPMHGNGAIYRQPVKSGGYVAHYHAGLATAYAAILARFRVETGGEGDHIDQAVYQSQAGFRDRRTVFMTAASYTGRPARRQQPGSRPGIGVRPCVDGYVNILGAGTRRFMDFLDVIGRPDLKEHEDAGKPITEYSQEFAEQLEGSYLAWLAVTPKREAIAATQGRGMLGGAIFTTEDLVTDPHYRARDYWETIDHPFIGAVEYPGRQIILSETPKQPSRHAPLLGEHNVEVYVGRLGYSKPDIALLRAQGVI
jgi:crotonobetainyl-CoA:carnitine CoA-transferase CaiB-like acyl-CoA transferase